MDFFFIEYRDPIFGLIVLFSVLLLVAIFSYFWGVFSLKDQKNSIDKFVNKFQSQSNLDQKYQDMLIRLDIDSGSLNALAGIFARSGEFNKAIAIYLIALQKAITKSQKELIFLNLGKAYLKAGFMQRSIEVFLEAIKISPKNIDALSHLGLGFEKLRLHDKSLEVLDALQEQGVDVAQEIAYTKALKLKNSQMEFEQKVAKMAKFANDFKLVSRMILELFIINGKDVNLINIKPDLAHCLDILYLNDGVLDGDEYKELYSAKGLNNAQISDFNLNLLKVARDNNLNATLSFNYICKECKGSYPLFFYRCNHCARLGSCAIIPNVIKESDENSISF
ncbi:tetratricopeptide repeat protein [Campylobacter devanensis]|uniref:tetratricopeptide repeat protein n=1 Tax=Campylobacter devanensis TaxID=3161138 RepID=UPI000A32FB09|nr:MULTISPECIES: tetratricopeptide repeat protein [unclassified Campylobacter]MEE3694670.1 tetratricopeptide repeat protein [Campylobacter sp. CLAX-22107-21]